MLFSIFTLLDMAEARVSKPDPVFNERTEMVMQILKAKQVLATKRSVLNGEIHKRLAAALVIANEQGADIYVPSRRCGTMFENGHSTKLIIWLDKAVAVGLLLSKLGKAKDRLQLSPMLANV